MVFGLVACLLLLAPLYGARLYQRFSVRRFIEKCTAAPLEPLDLESAPADGWIRFCPASWTSSDHPAADFRSWLRTEYLVAEFDVGSEPIPFRISYEMPSADFSYPETIRPMSTGRPLTVKYFFPVYEFHGPRLIPIPPNHFRGIMLREADRARLRGLSRVRNVEDFPILPCMFIPSDRSLFQWYRPLPALFCWPPSRP
jgi:hypothetical protein